MTSNGVNKQLLIVAVCLATLSFSPVRADLVTDWNRLALEAICHESTAPPLAARNLAIVHTSIYDAVNAINSTHHFYFFDGAASTNTSAEAAAIAAAHFSLVNVYPSRRATFDKLSAASLDAIADGEAKRNGVALGRAVASGILEWRKGDRAGTTVPYVPRTNIGAWRRTGPLFRPPELAHWPGLAPFGISNSWQFRLPGPPALSSSRYASDFNEVNLLGAAQNSGRRAEQTEAAHFWSDFSYTVTPSGHWNEIARVVGQSRGITLRENARLFALLNVALADAALVAWEAKYFYNSWRPITAIREADSDGNIGTKAAPGWTPLLVTPAFPEYPSGHSTLSAAAAEILASFFHTDQISFSIGSDSLPGVTRTFNSFSAAAEESGRSRIYGGIHFSSSHLDGAKAGRSVAQYVYAHCLLPRPEAQPALPGSLTNRFGTSAAVPP
jgi:hypothetical protein